MRIASAPALFLHEVNGVLVAHAVVRWSAVISQPNAVKDQSLLGDGKSNAVLDFLLHSQYGVLGLHHQRCASAIGKPAWQEKSIVPKSGNDYLTVTPE